MMMVVETTICLNRDRRLLYRQGAATVRLSHVAGGDRGGNPLALARTAVGVARLKLFLLALQNESLSSLRKSRLQYLQRCEELEKARQLSARAEDELQSAAPANPGSASKQLEKRRRSCEEAQAKVGNGLPAGVGVPAVPVTSSSSSSPLAQVQETEAWYKACIGDANFRRQELEKVRARIVSHIRKLIYQGDEVLTRVRLGRLRLSKRSGC